MRRRELIAKLKEHRIELRRTTGSIFSTSALVQRRAEVRLALLHALENLLPEIIEKLESQP